MSTQKFPMPVQHDQPEAPRAFVVFCPEVPPYRTHFHLRIARELPQFRLVTAIYHDSASCAWKDPLPPEIGVRLLAEGEQARSGGKKYHLGTQWRAGRAAVRLLDEARPAAVMVVGYDELVQLRVIRWCNARRVPVMVFGDSNIKCDQAAGLRRVLKNVLVPMVLARCDAVLACGTLGRRYFRRYGVPDDRIFYSPYEPDYHQIESIDGAAIARAAERYGLAPDRRRFVVSSRLIALKQVDAVIRAFASLAGTLPLWDLLILGDGPERGALQRLVPEPLRDRVRLAGFLGRQEDVTACYHNCHVLVHVPTYEPWALVINEAAAAGYRPCVFVDPMPFPPGSVVVAKTWETTVPADLQISDAYIPLGVALGTGSKPSRSGGANVVAGYKPTRDQPAAGERIDTSAREPRPETRVLSVRPGPRTVSRAADPRMNSKSEQRRVAEALRRSRGLPPLPPEEGEVDDRSGVQTFTNDKAKVPPAKALPVPAPAHPGKQ